MLEVAVVTPLIVTGKVFLLLKTKNLIQKFFPTIQPKAYLHP
jgi:hypothetical protein